MSCSISAKPDSSLFGTKGGIVSIGVAAHDRDAGGARLRCGDGAWQAVQRVIGSGRKQRPGFRS